MLRLTLVALALLAAAGCGGGDDTNRVLIETARGEVEFEVEIADTSPERQRGLMGRESLPEDAGMVFLFPQETNGGFWMKDTLIPLSIAFYDGGGRILRILDMEPCRRDPCTIYEPGVRYVGALEVNQGAFSRQGVSEGDVIRLGR